MRFAVLICFWVALIWPLIRVAGNGDDLLEALSSGSFNWTHGMIMSMGCGSPQDMLQSIEDPDTPAILAHRQATANMANALGEVRVDSYRDLSAIISRRDTIAAKVFEMAQAAELIEQVQLPDGSVEVRLQMSLRGGFSQLILPEEIVQVEAIRSFNSASGAIRETSPPHTESNGYSGLIVDARGINARPALVPLLVDETGKEVFGPAFVSREYAVQKGVCGYVRFSDGLFQMERIAPNPLLVKGLRSMGPNSCNIMISNADAFKLRDASTNLHFLKQCRVIIVLD